MTTVTTVTKPPFEAVVALHGAVVLRVCRAVLGAADAEDAWSETFLAALTAYPRLPGDANVEAWLVTIAHRKAIDITRAAARRAVPVADVPDRPAAQRADGRDLDLADALAALPRQAAGGRRLPLPGRTPLRRRRRRHRRQHRRRPPGGRRRDRPAPKGLPGVRVI